MKLNDSVYNVLKWLALLVLPASATLVKAIFPVWGLPYADAIATTLTSIATFIGVIIGVSQATLNSENKVVEVVTETEELDAETEYTDEAEEEKVENVEG